MPWGIRESRKLKAERLSPQNLIVAFLLSAFSSQPSWISRSQRSKVTCLRVILSKASG